MQGLLVGSCLCYSHCYTISEPSLNVSKTHALVFLVFTQQWFKKFVIAYFGKEAVGQRVLKKILLKQLCSRSVILLLIMLISRFEMTM